MDDNGGLGSHAWASDYYDHLPTMNGGGGYGLQLVDYEEKPLLSASATFFYHTPRNPMLEPPIDFLCDTPWLHHADAAGYAGFSLPIPPNPAADVSIEGLSTPTSPKKSASPAAAVPAPTYRRSTTARRSLSVVINGAEIDLSMIPSPVCSCTGTAHQCYRWGAGGWQSACCTTTTSLYPLPMSSKRSGARIAGRKMSCGAFKKVLEKLADKGFNLVADPIDLKEHWAKHGTNKFVTFR